MTMNLMSRKCLLNQAVCSPKYFDDVQPADLAHAQHRLFFIFRVPLLLI